MIIIILWLGNISSLLIFRNNIIITILQHELHSLLKFRNIPHFKLGTIPQKHNHIPITKQPLDSSYLHNIRINNLGHILTTYTRRHTDTTGCNSVSDPCLTCPCCCCGDYTYDGEDGDGWCNCFGYGWWSLVECFFGCECCFGCRCGGFFVVGSFASSAFCLCSTTSQTLSLGKWVNLLNFRNRSNLFRCSRLSTTFFCKQGRTSSAGLLCLLDESYRGLLWYTCTGYTGR